MYVLDWDRKTEWAHYSGASVGHFSKSELSDFISSLPSGELVIVESAHFQPRTPLSMAQVYTAYDLELLYGLVKTAGIEVLLFPEILSFRARAEQGRTKDEDTAALYGFIQAHPEISLMPWRLPDKATEYEWSYLNKIRNDCTLRLNIMRPDYSSEEVTRASTILNTHFEDLSDVCKDVFGISSKRKLLFNKSRVMSVYVTCFDESGNLRLNDQGSFIGLRTVWKVLKLHPYHRKAGTARSNLMYHTLRNLEGKVPGNKEVRSDFRRAIKDLVQIFRDAR